MEKKLLSQICMVKLAYAIQKYTNHFKATFFAFYNTLQPNFAILPYKCSVVNFIWIKVTKNIFMTVRLKMLKNSLIIHAQNSKEIHF